MSFESLYSASLTYLTLCPHPQICLAAKDKPTSIHLSAATAAEDHQSAPNIAHISWECMREEEMQTLIDLSESVIVIMPAKAAGTSLKLFAAQCNNDAYSKLKMPGNLPKESNANILGNDWEMPGVIASHFWNPVALSRLLHSTSRKTLVLYSHRDETSRFQSAATHVLTTWCPNGGGRNMPEKPSKFFDAIQGNNCYLSEDKLINKFLAKRYQEMEMGTNELLTCQTYSSIEEYAPNMVFVDYRNANSIQNLLAEKYCPHMLNRTMHAASTGEKVIYVTLENGSNVTLADWLDKKLSFLEWTLDLNKKSSCQVKTRRMEDELGSCDGGFLNAKAVVNK